MHQLDFNKEIVLKLWYVSPGLMYQKISLIMTSKNGEKYDVNNNNTGWLKTSLYLKWCGWDKHYFIYNQTRAESDNENLQRFFNFVLNFKKKKKNWAGGMLIKRSNLMQQYADIYLLQSHSTCFGCHSTHHQEH